MRKRIISYVLSLLMVISLVEGLFTMKVSAADPVILENTTVDLTALAPGTIIKEGVIINDTGYGVAYKNPSMYIKDGKLTIATSVSGSDMWTYLNSYNDCGGIIEAVKKYKSQLNLTQVIVESNPYYRESNSNTTYANCSVNVSDLKEGDTIGDNVVLINNVNANPCMNYTNGKLDIGNNSSGDWDFLF